MLRRPGSRSSRALAWRAQTRVPPSPRQAPRALALSRTRRFARVFSAPSASSADPTSSHIPVSRLGCDLPCFSPCGSVSLPTLLRRKGTGDRLAPCRPCWLLSLRPVACWEP